MTPYPGFKKVHFVGIGGSGMSGLAEVMSASGFEVSGSDLTLSSATDHLSSLGIPVVLGHEFRSFSGYDAVVYSSAVPLDNPELMASRKAFVPIIRRAELLGEMMKKKWSIAVSGTHGKTTTTLMLGSIWSNSMYSPTVIGGGAMRGKLSGVTLGSGEFLIAEADEYDKSFLSMYPTVLLINNIDNDHLECYGSLEEIKKAFIQVSQKLPFCGFTVVNAQDPGAGDIIKQLSGKVVTFGFSPSCDYYAVPDKQTEAEDSFDVYMGSAKIAHIELQVYGAHNLSNALGAFALSHVLGIPADVIAEGLKNFQGASRRLEKTGSAAGISFLDDYAHHPSEIRAALAAVRCVESGRLVCVFQPHLFSRTLRLYKDFARELMNCDKLFVTPVYASREKPLEGVQGDLIIDEARRLGHKDACYLEKMELAAELIKKSLEPGDIVMTVGAGDIWKLGKTIHENMR